MSLATLARARRGVGWLAAHPRLLAVLGASCIAFSGILVRLSGASPSTATVFRALYALPILILLAVPEDRRLGPPARRARLLAVGAGLFFAIDLTTFHLAIEEMGAGLATVMGNLQAVVVGIVAWLIVLALSAQLAGGLLIAASLPFLPAVVSSLILLSQPVAAVVLAALLIGEAPSPFQLTGVGLVLAGVALGTVGGIPARFWRRAPSR